MDKWKYYGRTGGGRDPFEICRFPDNGQVLDDQDHTHYPEWLQPDGTWVFFPNDISIFNERANGNFDEEIDELAFEQVKDFFTSWTREGWPGRIAKK